jgi:GTP-binding protein HflX
MKVVDDVLTQLEAHNNPTLTVYNKCDAQPNPDSFAGGSENVLISAKKGTGIENLKDAITKKLSDLRAEISILLPSSAGAVVSRLYASGEVHTCEYREDGIFIRATVTAEEASRLQSWSK